MNRRLFLKSSSAALSLVFLAPEIGCGKGQPSQSQLAALAQALGTSLAGVVAILGMTALAKQISDATAVVVTDIKNWVPGSTSADIIQAIGILETLINSIPVTPEIQALILLALGTIQGILALFPPAAGAVAARTTAPQVVLAKVPHTKAEYAAQWNLALPTDPKFASAKIQ